MNWFISDLHFGHNNIIKMERTQFETVEDHDAHILKKLRWWAESKAKNGDTLWVLGDFWNTDMLQPFWECFQFDDCDKRIFLNFVYGNHDKHEDFDKFNSYFDKVFLYPQFVEKRIVVSHEPQYPIPPYMINIHGHLHGAHLDTNQHFTVSCNDIGYVPQSMKYFQNKLQFIEPWNMRFLWEPYAEEYVFHDKNRAGVVMNPKTSKVDIHASRVLQKAMRDDNWNLGVDKN